MALLIRKAYKSLTRLIKYGEYKKIPRAIIYGIWHQVFKIVSHTGVRVVEEDWDYLIVLDACRYDVFKEVNTIPGRLERKISLGSCTTEWLIKNFPGYYEDIVYVSANPRISHVEIDGFRGTDHFYKVIHVWDFGWDEELGTVPPDIVTDTALEVVEKYPDKRIIIHYMQPHAPWIGETRLTAKDLGISFKSAIEWFRNSGKISPWGLFGKAVDVVGLDFIRKAYRDNLKLVLKEVKRLVDKLEGKIVITSDHGECFGEKFIIEHPGGIYIRELVEVPWLVIEKN